MSEPTTSQRPASPRQVLLGLFILGQIAFLVIANFLGFVKWFPTLKREKQNELINRALPKFAEKQGHGWQWSEQLDANVRLWTDLSGQDQGWSLFAPTVAKETGFPATLLSWDDPATEDLVFPGAIFTFDQVNGFNIGAPWNHPESARQPSLSVCAHVGVIGAATPWDAIVLEGAAHLRDREKAPATVLLRSPNEPADLHQYVRIGQSKVRKFEGNFYFNPQPYSSEDAEQLGTRLNAKVREVMSDYHDFAHAYLRWRLQAWQREHPGEATPDQVILLQRFFRLHDPGEKRGWDGPYVIPVARWRPNQPPRDGFYALEVFDFNDQRFMPMTRYR